MALSAIALTLGAVSVGSSVVNTINAENQAQQTQAQENQLLSEANQQVANEQKQNQLIANRDAQEETLLNPNSNYTADNTLLTPPQLASSVPQGKSGQPAQLLGG